MEYNPHLSVEAEERFLINLNILLYLLKRLGGKADKVKLFKILYFADQTYLVRYGQPLSPNSYVAMKHGPVPSELYDLVQSLDNKGWLQELKTTIENHLHSEGYIIESKSEPDLDYLAETEREVLDEMVEKYGGYNFNQLSGLSHDAAWNNVNPNDQMDVKEIARAGGAADEMLEFIELYLENERASV